MTFSEFKLNALGHISKIKDVETAKRELDYIILHCSGMSLAEYLTRKNDVVSDGILTKLNEAFKRLCNNEPIQYIIGKWEFYGLDIFCGKGCLIPRPETELLAHFAIQNLARNGKFLDLCTGSGCITCAILKNRPDTFGVGVDISAEALAYANKNIDYHGLGNRFKAVMCDIAHYTPDFCPDMIISNPPYVKSADMLSLQKELYFEPSIALDGGSDGMYFYNLIVNRFKDYIKKGTNIAFEVGYDTAEQVLLLLKNTGFVSNSFVDSNGIVRVITGIK